MDFALTDDQLDLQKSFGRLFAAHSDSTVVRAAEPLGFSAELWRRLAELGVPQLASAAAGDGKGPTLSQLIVIAGEYGRRLAPVPLMETLVTARLLDRFDQPPTSGIGTLALRPAKADGSLPLLAAGAIADSVVALSGDELVLAELAGEPELRAQPRRQPAGQPDVGQLPHRARSRRRREGTPPAGVGRLEGPARRRSGRRRDRGAHDDRVAYVKERKAFNVPIGWFQTVAHRLADAMNDLDGARVPRQQGRLGDRRGPPRRAQPRVHGLRVHDRTGRAGHRGVACTCTEESATPSSTTSSCTSAGPRRGRWRSAIRGDELLRWRPGSNFGPARSV